MTSLISDRLAYTVTFLENDAAAEIERQAHGKCGV